jgi:hypothetical protein
MNPKPDQEPGSLASKMGRGMPKRKFLDLLRAAALIAVLVGAMGSVGLTLRAGHRNPSRLLQTLFALWVLSPFGLLALAIAVSKPWSVFARMKLYGVTLVLALGSLALYGNTVFGPPRPKVAFVFVVMPPASCLLMLIAAAVPHFRHARAGRTPPTRTDGALH